MQCSFGEIGMVICFDVEVIGYSGRSVVGGFDYLSYLGGFSKKKFCHYLARES